MPQWEGRSVIKVVTPRSRYYDPGVLVVVEAATPQEAEQRIKDESTSSRLPLPPGDQHVVKDLRQLDPPDPHAYFLRVKPPKGRSLADWPREGPRLPPERGGDAPE